MAISETVFKAAVKRAMAEGEAKGRRLERRALRRLINRPLALTPEIAIAEIREWLAKRGRRKG